MVSKDVPFARRGNIINWIDSGTIYLTLGLHLFRVSLVFPSIIRRRQLWRQQKWHSYSSPGKEGDYSLPSLPSHLQLNKKSHINNKHFPVLLQIKLFIQYISAFDLVRRDIFMHVGDLVQCVPPLYTFFKNLRISDLASQNLNFLLFMLYITV